MSHDWTLDGIAYEEIEGSPTFAGGRDGPTAQRIFKLDWSDVGAYVTKFFPAAIRTGKGWIFPVALSFPARPYLVASTYRIEPWDATKTTGVDSNNVRAYEYAKVTIDYKAPDYDPEDRGKDPGKTGDQILADWSIAFSAEMLKLGVSGWTWSGVSTKGADEPIKNEDASLNKLVSQIEHTLSWNYVPLPPFRRLATYVGTLNSDAKLFYAPVGTLLFVGAEIKRSYHSQTDDESWKVTYKFLQRCIREKILGTNPTMPGQGAVGDVTWNHLYRNDAGMWDKPKKEDGTFIYSSNPFAGLFQSDESDNT